MPSKWYMWMRAWNLKWNKMCGKKRMSEINKMNEYYKNNPPMDVSLNKAKYRD